jgi:hypothetical protein
MEVMKPAAVLAPIAMILAAAQVPPPSNGVFLNPAKPGVYVTFVRMGSREPQRVDESKRGAFFQLHNNTRWSLLLHMNGVPHGNGDAGLFYDVVEDPSGYPPSPLPIGERMHVSSVDNVKPGTSLTFSVPEEHIAQGLGIQLEFSYEWEADERTGMPRAGEPSHVVVFYHSGLPEALRRGERRRPSIEEGGVLMPSVTAVPSDTPKHLDLDTKKKQK